MNVQKIRKDTGLSQSRFAEHFKIPVSTLQDWEQGRRKPPPYVVGMIKRIIELEQTEIKAK